MTTSSQRWCRPQQPKTTIFGSGFCHPFRTILFQWIIHPDGQRSVKRERDNMKRRNQNVGDLRADDHLWYLIHLLAISIWLQIAPHTARVCVCVRGQGRCIARVYFIYLVLIFYLAFQSNCVEKRVDSLFLLQWYKGHYFFVSTPRLF